MALLAAYMIRREAGETLPDYLDDASFLDFAVDLLQVDHSGVIHPDFGKLVLLDLKFFENLSGLLLSEKVVLRHEPVRWIKRVSSCCQIFTIPLVPYRSTGKTLTKQFPASVPHT
jgi:hypothetical protein